MSRAMPGLRHFLSHSPLSPPSHRHPHSPPNPPSHPNPSSHRNSPSSPNPRFYPHSNFHSNSRPSTVSPAATTSSSPSNQQSNTSPRSPRRLHQQTSPHRLATPQLKPLLSRSTPRNNRRSLSPVSPVFKSPVAVSAVTSEFASPPSSPPPESFLQPTSLPSPLRAPLSASLLGVEGPSSQRSEPSSPPPRKRPATARPAGPPRFVRAHPRVASSMRTSNTVSATAPAESTVSPITPTVSPTKAPFRHSPGGTTRNGAGSSTRPTVRPVSDENVSPTVKGHAQQQSDPLSPSGGDALSTSTKSHLRYGTVGLRAGFLRQDSRPFAFLAVKANRYARLQGTLLSLAKGPHGEVIWSFDIAGSVVETIPDDRKIAIFMVDSQRRKRRVMVLSPPDAKSFHKWSVWLSRASKSVLEMHYSMDRLISKGAFARVVLGKDLHTGEHVAIKLIEKSNAPPSERKYFEREVKIMQTLSHTNIVRCYDVFDTRLRTRIVMEYMEGGTLGDLITNHKGPLPESIARHIMHGILSGVKYLHDNSTIHRDLKPDNCLLSKTKPPYGPVKLSDFGLSNIVDGGAKLKRNETEQKGFLTSAVGSPAFVAPEIFESRYGTAVDIWSCGIILYMMLSGGSLPFRGQSASEVVSHARSGRIDFSSKYMRQTSDLAKRFLLALLHVDSNKRPTAQQALAHPWLVGNSSSTQPK